MKSFCIIFSESFEYLIEENLQMVSKEAWAKSPDTVDQTLDIVDEDAADEVWKIVRSYC